MTPFIFPSFYSYPPYFTLQVVKETKEKQSSLWGSLILSFCKHHKIFILNVNEDISLFHNESIQRTLQYSARISFLDDLVKSGRAEWVDSTKAKCIIYWKKIEEWADAISTFSAMYGLSDSVMTIEELISSDSVRDASFYEMDRTVMMKVLAFLESRGKVKIFQGANYDEEGIKFL